MSRILFFISVAALFSVFTVGLAFGKEDGSEKDTHKHISEQCNTFISWFNDGEQKLLVRLNGTNGDDRYGAAQEVLEHPQNHAQTVVSRAMDVAYAGRLYSTIDGISNIVLNKIDADDGLFEKYSNACNVSVNPQAYRFDISLRIEAAMTLGQFAHTIVIENADYKGNDNNGEQETGDSDELAGYLNEIINTFTTCLTTPQPDMLQASCAEAGGNTYSKSLSGIFQYIVYHPLFYNSALVLASARSLTQINTFTQSTTLQTQAMQVSTMKTEANPPSYITDEMVYNAMNYLKQFIPQTH